MVLLNPDTIVPKPSRYLDEGFHDMLRIIPHDLFQVTKPEAKKALGHP
jgi:hypothetical protein